MSWIRSHVVRYLPKPFGDRLSVISHHNYFQTRRCGLLHYTEGDLNLKRVLFICLAALGVLAALGASSFYLFVYPALVAREPARAGVVGVLFASFLMIQLWMLIAEFAYQSAAAFYGFKRDRLLPFRPRTGFGVGFIFSREGQPKAVDEPAVSGGMAVVLMFLSYAFTMYAFGVVFVFLSSLNADAFNVRLSLSDALYFSVITSATVGFGDITPRSSGAKMFVCAEVWMSLLYVVLLFSVASSYLRERRVTVVNTKTAGGSEAARAGEIPTRGSST